MTAPAPHPSPADPVLRNMLTELAGLGVAIARAAAATAETEARVVAVLDWELSTLGDPLADLGNSVLAWHMEPELFRGLKGCDLAGLGVPSEAAFLQAYWRASGRAAPDGFDVYVVFALFRLAAIIQGIAKRALEGTASSADAAALGGQAGPIAERGWELACRM